MSSSGLARRRVNARRPSSAPVPISTPSGTLKRHRRLGGALHDAADDGRGGVDLLLGHLEDQLVMDLHQHPRPRRAPRLASAGPIRAIARLMMSAAVPWIGALIAARSAPWRSCWILDLIRGKWVLRPNRVVVKPVSRTSVERVGDIVADAGEALEIAVDDRLRLVGGDRRAAPARPQREMP